MNQPIGYLIKKITDKIKVSADASLKSRNITLSQVRVLEYVADKGGRVTQKSIEEYLNVAHPTVVGIVSRMEKNGYLISYADREDKRNKIVETTEKAVRISHEIQSEMYSMEKRLLKGLTAKEAENLGKMLGILYKNLDE